MQNETVISHDFNCDVMTKEKTLMSTRTAMILITKFKEHAQRVLLGDLKQDLEFQVGDAKTVEELEQVCISFLELRMILKYDFDNFRVK
jgi:hypothetical protein